MKPPRYKWQPTTAEIAASYGLRPSDIIRFDHNTSPFPSDWAAGIVAPMAQGLNEYPGASYAALRDAAAEYLGTQRENVVPGAGVDEILLLIAKAFLGPGSRAVAVVPTYPLYEIATLQRGAEFRTVSLEASGFAFPTQAICEAAETAEVTWLCVPNNPTGHRIPDELIADVIRAARGLVVIDAAYAEFTGDAWAPWIERFDNLIVCHTMSKGFGLAAIRVGFAMSRPDLVDALDGVRPPGSISSMSASLAEEALRTPQRMRRHVERIVRERSRLNDALGALGIPTVPDSSTNFVLCEIGPAAHRLADDLMREGIIARRFPENHALAAFLRFTVRAPDEDDRLIDTLRRHLT